MCPLLRCLFGQWCYFTQFTFCDTGELYCDSHSPSWWYRNPLPGNSDKDHLNLLPHCTLQQPAACNKPDEPADLGSHQLHLAAVHHCQPELIPVPSRGRDSKLPGETPRQCQPTFVSCKNCLIVLVVTVTIITIAAACAADARQAPIMQNLNSTSHFQRNPTRLQLTLPCVQLTLPLAWQATKL